MRIVVCLLMIVLSVAPLAEGVAAQKLLSTKTQLSKTVVKGTQFEGISAISDGRATWLSWQMSYESGNIGFNVYRVDGSGSIQMLTPDRIVAGAAMRSREIPQYGQTYSFYDQNGTGSSAYFVETIGLDGSRMASQRVYPSYVPSLSAATGLTDEQMLNTAFHPRTLEDAGPIFTKDIRSEMEESHQLADPSTHRMVISQPGVVRIGVKKEGLYRVTAAQLSAAGFDTSSDPTNWQLYVEGVEQSILVGSGGSYIEFYGVGRDLPETDVRVYYLMNGGSAGKRMASRTASANTSTVVSRSYSQTFVKKERFNYLEDVFNGDVENYWGRSIGSASNGTTMTFNLSSVDFSSVDSSMQLSFQGYSGGGHSIEVILNGQVLAPAVGTELNNFSQSYAIATSLLREGSNSIRFRAMDNPADFCFFDTMSISFNRRFVAQNDRLNFPTTNYRAAQVGGFTTSSVRVFDITRDGDPVVVSDLPVQQTGATFGVTMPAARGRSFFAVADGGLLSADSITPNNPELVGVPTNGADLIIVAYKDFMGKAETWANYRRGQGLTVKVIEVSELFDEFNYGTFGSSGLKDFFQYAYDNWQVRPQYVMLMGDASWDPKNYEETGYWDMIPAKMVRTTYSETASDEALVDFDNNGLTEMAIGRIPARSLAEIDTMYTKTLNWESALTPTSMNRGVLFAYDFNNGYPFSTMSQNLRNQLPQTVPSTFVFRGEVNANANLITAMNLGNFSVNYSGHGTAGSWGGSPLFFNVNSVPLTAEHNPSIYTMLTCLNGYYHWLYYDSIAEVLLKAPNRGAVIAWGSSGLTLPDAQEAMATRFYFKLGEGMIPRMGDLVRDAKSVLSDRNDVRYSWALLGDPMLKVR